MISKALVAASTKPMILSSSSGERTTATRSSRRVKEISGGCGVVRQYALSRPAQARERRVIVSRGGSPKAGGCGSITA